jgi:hypothetical protein
VSWAEVLKSLAFWGPGAILAGAMVYALYKLADKFIDKFATDFIGAQRAQAESLARMAHGAEGLRECINGFVARDNKEHREIIILLKVITEKIEHLEEPRGS